MALEAAIESRCARRDKDACRRGVLFTCPHPRLLRAQCECVRTVAKRRALKERTYIQLYTLGDYLSYAVVVTRRVASFPNQCAGGSFYARRTSEKM
jgi:hypothetical protein